MKKRIYLDYASITPIDKKVSKEVFRVSKKYIANPSSLYREGVEAMNFLQSCRKRVSDIIEAHSDEIIFTSGGTESNALGIMGVIAGYKKLTKEKDNSEPLPHIISTTIEHPSIRELLFTLEKSGEIELTMIAPEENGIIDAVKIAEALKPQTALVSIMYANNEIGTIMPLGLIAKKLREYKREQGRTEFEMPFLHSDASQATQYLSMRVSSLHVDLMTMDGGKIYGPRGVGVLFVKRIVPFESITNGGSQEDGRRAGTENLPGIAGFALALEMVENGKEKEYKRVEKLRDVLLADLKLSEIGDKFSINGTMAEGQGVAGHGTVGQVAEQSKRLPNNLNICFRGIDAEFLVITLDAMGLCVSSVTSCRTLTEDSYSYVVQEVVGEECSKSSLRISLGKYTSKSDIMKAGKLIVEAVGRIL